MKILRLELFGFKSFKDKTIISFDQLITAIVGSNGCGKSNVIDALYWVMGDMSAKHLRGTKMSDVIFGGSRDHAPLDMAEVSLVLERDPEKDPELPTQFQVNNEIKITRRYFRSGDTEYLINNIQCRLRDIQEFFMDTGVGVKAYSIIEQGAIARLVTQKPEDRRTVIEEVAGIMKFKARKAETERKIANSRANLTRIDDILKDLRKSLSTLKAQATKAEKYRSYSDELRALELRLASREWMTRTGDKIEAAQVVEKLRTEVSSNENALEELKARLEESELNLVEMETELDQSRITTREAEVQVKELEGRMGSLNTRKDSLREQVDAHELSLEEIATRSTTLESELTEIVEEVERLSLKNEDAFIQVEARIEAVSIDKEASQRISEELQLRRKDLHEIELSQTRLTQEIQGFQNSLSNLNKRKEVVETQLTSVQSEIQGKESAKTETLTALEEAFSTRTDLEELKNQVDTDLSDLENKRTELTQIRDTVREDLTVVRVRKEQLEALDKNLEGVEASSRALALHLREQGVEDSLLLDAINVPSTFEKAVESALGHNLERVKTQSFYEIEDLKAFIESNDEIKSQAAHFWIPGISAQNSRASRTDLSLDSMFVSDGFDSQLTQNSIPPEGSHTPTFNSSFSHWAVQISESTSEITSESDDSLRAATQHFSERPGPDGMLERTTEDLSKDFEATTSAPRLKTLRDYLLSRSDVIGPMNEVLKNEGTTQDWLVLVEDFWLVRSRESFAAILKDVDALPVNLVSLDGDVLWKTGFMDLAPLSTSESVQNTSLVKRKREIQELRVQEGTLQEELASAQQFLDDCQNSWNQAKTKFRELTAQLAALNPDVENLSTLLRQDEATLARLHEKVSMLTAERKNIEIEMASISGRIEILVADLESSEDNKTAAEERAAESLEELDRINSELKTKELELSNLQSEHRQTERDLSAAETKRATLEHERNTSNHRKGVIEEQLIEIDAEIRNCVQDIEAKLEEISIQTERFQQAQLVESELLQKFQLAKSALKEDEIAFDTKNRETQRISNDIRDLQQQMAIHDVELKNLSQKLADQYHIQIESLTEEQLREVSTPLDTEELADPAAARAQADALRQKIDRLGKINMVAVEEFDEKSQRFEFLFIQRQDVFDGVQQLEDAIDRIDRESRERFSEAYNAVNQAFKDTFPILFGGGTAELRLTDPDNLLETGVEIVAQPPGKKLQSVTLLSGGEKALTAVSLIFGIFSIKPSPFCVLDEVDAPLDDANVGRFNQQIRKMSETSQIIMITHHKHTMESADALFGVTMENPGVSKVASVELGELKVK